MEAVPGLRYTAEIKADVKKRYGLELALYPHWTMLNALGRCVFCDGQTAGREYLRSISNAKLVDIHSMARKDAPGVLNIATGYKRSDSPWRRRQMALPSAMRNIVCPLANWTRAQVLAYLHSRNITVPEDMGGEKFVRNGVDLNTRSVCWLYDTFPDDYAKLESVFPYVGAIIARRKFYGIAT
jgi:3'-phosphoadenosine 5'-phosphosulfate sulfotransferase (PAPS reductase)/FAD synthetase